MEKVKTVYRIVRKGIFYVMRIFKIDSRKIVISSYFGKGYSCNAKYITEYLLAKNPKLKVIWLVKDMSCEMPEKIIKVKYKSLRSTYELATAKIWIDNSRKAGYVRKRKDQIYIQTWHGSIALKKIEKDAEHALPKDYIDSAKNDSKMIDAMISNGKFCTEMYKRAFWYDKKIFEVGTPRNDIFFQNKTEKNLIKEKLGIGREEKIVLYAPTFRKVWNEETYNLDCEKVIDKLEKKFEGKWQLLIRLHPVISAKKKKSKNLNQKIIDVTDYSDMQELLYISDVLITDYSSSMFDFMLTKKPIFLYASDVEEYKKDRGFYFDYYKLPFKVAENNKKLLRLIEKFDKNEYDKEVERFIKTNGIIENGKAVEQVGDFILNKV